MQQNFNPQMPPSAMGGQASPQMSPMGGQPPPQMSPMPQQAGAAAMPTGAGTAGGMDMAQIMEYIKTLEEPERSQYMAMLSQDYGGRRDSLDEQMESANMLRDAPPVRGQMAGDVLVGTGGLEGIARGIGMYKGGKDAKRIRGERDMLSQDMEQGISGIQQAMLRGS